VTLERDYETEEQLMRKKLFSILLSACLVLSLLPIGALAADAGFPDMPAENHWSYKALTAAIDNGLLQGSGGRLMPQENLTRAQLAAFINRAFGAQALADISGYSDVKTAEWYDADIAKAVRMGTLAGDAGMMRPNADVTRQEAFTALARALKLPDGSLTALDGFADKAAVSPWAAPALAAMTQAGYIQGTDGRLNPMAIMTREQFAQVMYNVFARYITKAGTYTESIKGNVLVNTGDVTLKGLTVTGDLILGEGVGNGDVTLDGVTVTGRVVVRGGGENSIRIINKTDVGSIIVGKTGDGGVRIRTEEGCQVEVVYIDDGLDDIILEGTFNQVSVETDAPIILRDATVTGLTVSGTGADVKLDGKTTVSVTQITEQAEGAKLEVGNGAKVTKVESGADGVTISGGGTVTQAIVSGNNTAVDTKDTKVTVEDGATGVTQDGEPVDPETPSNPPSDGDVPHSATVTSLADLQAALDDSNVTAVTIRESIIIPADTTITFNKPVTIADLPGSILTVNGTLINNSMFTSRGLGSDFNDTGVVLVEGSFTNNGTFVNESRFGMFRGTFTNSAGGTIQNKNWFHCIGTIITNNGAFSGMGDITLINTSAYGEGDHAATFTNAAGATFVSEGPGGIQVRKTCSFTNDGTATVSGSLENYGTLTNTGSFTYTDFFLNAGTITGMLTEGEDAVLENDRPVTSIAELKTQLTTLDGGYDRIAIIGDIALTEDLTIRHNVRLTPDGSLTVPSERTLTVTSDSAYNELNVSGKLDIYGTLVTTQTGEGEDAVIGQVTLTGGALRAYSGSTITNGGNILVLRGEVTQEDGVTFTGHDIIYPSNIVGVSSASEFVNAMADDGVDEIEIVGSFTLNEDVDITKRTTVTYDTMEDPPRILTIASGATVTVRDGGYLSILGGVVNNGMLVNNSEMFMGIGGSFTNSGTGILNVNNRFDIIEGTLTNSGEIDVSAGDNHTLLMRGGTITNNAGADFINEGSVDMDSSEGMEGVVTPHEPTFTNAGTFDNGAFEDSQAYFGMKTGTLTNTGTFRSNCHMDLRYTDFVHTGADVYFATYNTGGLNITGGSLTTTGAANGTFNNEGYMSITDEYGKVGGNNICVLHVDNGDLDNDSHWLEYIAAVYSEDGLEAAETAQTDKITTLGGGDNYFGLSVYNRLQILGDITISGDRTLSTDFGSYWVGSTWSWNGTQDVQTPGKLTVNDGVTLTVPAGCNLHAESGIIDNKGIISIFAGGSVDVWPQGIYSNTNAGAVADNGNDNGEFYIRHEYDRNDNDILMPNVSGLGVTPAKFIAMVYTEPDLLAANSSGSPVFDRIEIKGDSDIALTGAGTLTIDKNVYIEPGSGLIIPFGKELELTGEHSFNNGGDITVWGDMTIGDGVNFHNEQNIDIGAELSEEYATVTVLSGGNLFNNGNITLYDSGTLNASAGQYGGINQPNEQGGTYTPPEP
jgi:hypothetical protein